MATGQNHFIATNYGEVLTFDAKNGGWQSNDYATAVYRSFPTSGTVFTAISPAQVIGGATCNAIIEVLPQGLNIYGKKYATDSTVAALNALAT